MGYTHYWYQCAPIRGADWLKIKSDTVKLIEAAPCKLAFEEGDPDPPRVSDAMIRFNGTPDPDGHETFLLEPFPRNPFYPHGKTEAFTCCKTAYKPYDIVVCGVLAVARAASPTTIRVSSDGGEDAWRKALDWASRVLGYPVLFPVGDYAEKTRTTSTPA